MLNSLRGVDQSIMRNKYLQRFMAVSHNADGITAPFNTLFLCEDKDTAHKDILEFEYLYRLKFSDEKVLRISGNDFVTSVIGSAMCGNSAEFKKSFRNLNLLIFEDVEEISGKQACMEAAYIIVDYLLENHRCMVFTSDYLPCELHALENRNRTQFEGCPIHDLRESKEF